MRPFFTEGFSGFVTSTAASVVTGRNERAPGRYFRPLWSSAFSQRAQEVSAYAIRQLITRIVHHAFSCLFRRKATVSRYIGQGVQ
jgi:hypothetical protein